MVGLLESKHMFFSLLSLEKDKANTSGETFLKVKEAETLPGEHLAM